MADHEALPVERVENDIESFDGSVRIAIPDDYFLKEEKHHNPDQRSQLPLGNVSLSPPRRMTPPPIPLVHDATHGRRIVIPPESYSFENQVPEVTMRHAPSQSPTPEKQPLEGLEGSQWAYLSVLLIDEPKSY